MYNYSKSQYYGPLDLMTILCNSFIMFGLASLTFIFSIIMFFMVCVFSIFY